jgi:hypothetical protein
MPKLNEGSMVDASVNSLTEDEEDADWMLWDEEECDEILKNSPLDNKARFRLS